MDGDVIVGGKSVYIDIDLPKDADEIRSEQ
jgi:hypothetical protein